MKIYHKLIFLLILTALFSTALTSLIFLDRQNRNIKESQKERLDIIVSNARKIAEEAEIADDSLMVVDYANSLARTAEVGGVDIKVKKLPWKKIRKPEAEKAGNGPPSEISSKNHKIKIYFSDKYLAEELRREKEKLARNAVYTGAGAALLASLAALFLGIKISKKLKTLELQAEKLGAGQFEAEPGMKGGDEIAELSRKMSEAAVKLKELEEMKREFISSATHELKSPLGAIESYINLFARNRSSLSEEESKNLENIKRNIRRLSSFITGMLNLSKIEKGTMEFLPKQDDPADLVRDSFDFFKARAGEAGIKFSLDCPAGSAPPVPQVPGWSEATQFNRSSRSMPTAGGKTFSIDRELLTHVVSNLISNALKFTPAGGEVKLRAFLKAGTFRFEISDTGPGIDPAAAQKLFIPFSRLKNDIKTEGTGLGLALSKKIIDLHGGRIGVVPEKGKGGFFFFELPPPGDAAKGKND